jgi:Immunity protein 35
MDFEKAAALAAAWVEILCEGGGRIVRESTIAKPYGWIFFYQAKEFLDDGTESARLVGNAPIIVNRNTSELRVTGTARPLDHYLAGIRENAPSCLPSTRAATSDLVSRLTLKRYDGARPLLWPHADLVQRLPSRQLLGVKRTRFAHRELFRV